MRHRNSVRLLVGLVLVMALWGQAVKVGKLYGRKPTRPSKPFTVLTATEQTFNVTLAKFPTWPLEPDNTPMRQGWQGGDFVAGKALFYPWADPCGVPAQCPNGAVPNSVFLVYDGTPTTVAFNDKTHWNWIDLTSLTSCTIPGDDTHPCSYGYNSGVVAGTKVYFVPGAQGGYPQLVQYDASGNLAAVSNAASYATVNLPARGGAMGSTYGWGTGVYDGVKYVYFAPNQDSVVVPGGVVSGNIIRIDSSVAFTIAAVAHFDINTIPGVTGVGGYQGSCYDGHQYMYFPPFTETKIMTRVNLVTGFTVNGAYSFLNLTVLGSAGKPAVAGVGSPTNLWGYNGCQMAWEPTGHTEYMYLVPWSSFNSQGVNQLKSTVLRVPVGTCSNNAGASCTAGNFTAADVFSASATWEMYDVAALTTNPVFIAQGWAPLYTTGQLVGQSVIAGYQLSYLNTVKAGGPYVGFAPSDAQYWLEHKVSGALTDSSTWYVGSGSVWHSNQSFGGAYDATNQIFYPSPPSTRMLQEGGL